MTKIQTMTRTDRNIKMQAIMITSRSPEAIPEKLITNTIPHEKTG